MVTRKTSVSRRQGRSTSTSYPHLRSSEITAAGIINQVPRNQDGLEARTGSLTGTRHDFPRGRSVGQQYIRSSTAPPLPSSSHPSFHRLSFHTPTPLSLAGLLLKMFSHLSLLSLAALSLVSTVSAQDQCLSYGIDFQDGGSYFIDTNSNQSFTTVSEFSGQ